MSYTFHVLHPHFQEGPKVMCGDHASSSKIVQRWDWVEKDVPPDSETVELPPDHILQHCTAIRLRRKQKTWTDLVVTDAHCHPTDLDITTEEFDTVRLGGACAMATVPEDQGKVMKLGSGRPWETSPRSGGMKPGLKVVSAFGYHPWFTHRYTLLDPPPSKSDHYRSIFFPQSKESNTKHLSILESLLPCLPDPILFQPLLKSLEADIQRSKAEGRLTMLGEVGLDGGARMRWPPSARHLYDEKYPSSEDEGDWNRLTPFKASMGHQRAIVEAQIGIAVEQGVNVSFHSVAAPGPTMDVLRAMREKFGWRFTHGIKVDIHSAGGWSPQFWTQAEKQFPNLYASPSILITGRSQSAPDLIRAISPDRILVESDSHDIRLSTRLVWAATHWIAGCRGWKVEDGEDQWDSPYEAAEACEEEDDGHLMSKIEEKEQWAVRTLERNMANFLGIGVNVIP